MPPLDFLSSSFLPSVIPWVLILKGTGKIEIFLEKGNIKHRCERFSATREGWEEGKVYGGERPSACGQ